MHSPQRHGTSSRACNFQPFRSSFTLSVRNFRQKQCAVIARSSPHDRPQQQEQLSQHTIQHQCSRRQAMSAAAAIAAGASLGFVQPAYALPDPAAAGAAEILPLVPHVPVAPGLELSKVVKGCWQLSGGHKGEKETDRTAGEAAVKDFDAFVSAGITTFDAADHYGPAEALIGRYLQQRPGIRDTVQVCTKYCVFSGRDMATLSKASVSAAVDVSRQRLGVDKIDLLQFYWADYDYPKYVDAALYLAELQEAGVIGAVGVTNFDVPRLEAMVNKGAKLVSNQVQYSLLDRRPANVMADYCQAQNISLLPYGVVAGGFLSDRYLNTSPRDVNVNTYSKGKYASVLGQAGGWNWLQQLLQVLKQVADKHSTSISNVASRWVLQQPAVPAVILGARNALHVPDHQRLFTFELDSADLATIDEVLQAGNKPLGDCYDWERGGKW